MMDQRDAMLIVFQAVQELTKAGYAVTGNLHFVRMTEFEPRMEGRLGTVAEPHAHCKFVVAPAGTNGHQIVKAVNTPETMAPTHLGEACFKCGGGVWIQSGACKTCAGCGESGGCG